MNEHRSKDSLLTNGPAGLSVLTACLFIVGEIAGTGILALPEAVKSCGWSGVIAIVIICISSAFTGVVLGKCWLILENRDETLKTIKTRNAYSLIGQRALGSTGKLLASSSQGIQLFGGSVVSLLLLAENIQRLTDALGFHLTFCEWIVITGLILLPFTFAGSPVDFWPIAITAMSSTAIASILILVEVVRQKNLRNSLHSNDNLVHLYDIGNNLTAFTMSIDSPSEPSDFVITAKSYLLGLSTMTYGFAGASAMPTIQNDMKNKSKFTIAVILAFILLLLIYLPVSIVGYAVYGDNLRSNVMRNLTNSPLVTITDVLIAIHVFSAYLILLNPVNLNVEHALNITHAFNFSRCFSRTTVSVVAIFVGLCIPKFGQLLNLVGASAVCLQSFILPCIFYYRLQSNPSLGAFNSISSLSSPPSTEFNESSYTISSHLESTSTYICTSYSSITSRIADVTNESKLSMKFKVLLLILILLAITLAIIGSFYSLVDLFDPQAFTIPCFICNTDRLT